MVVAVVNGGLVSLLTMMIDDDEKGKAAGEEKSRSKSPNGLKGRVIPGTAELGLFGTKFFIFFYFSEESSLRSFDQPDGNKNKNKRIYTMSLGLFKIDTSKVDSALDSLFSQTVSCAAHFAAPRSPANIPTARPCCQTDQKGRRHSRGQQQCP